MAEFKKYTSIENSYREEEIKKCREFVAPEAEWVAIEKVHGANFAIYIYHSKKDGKFEIKFAKRSGFVDTPEERKGFFDFTPIEDELRAAAEKVAPIVPPGSQLVIYGELIGNNSHPNLDKPWVKNGRIQKDIPYTNKMAFLVFDVRTPRGYLPHDSVVKFERYGFIIAPRIARGTLDECLAVDPETLKSRVPQLMEHDEHIVDAEGIIIKPVVPHYTFNGKRIMVKQKRKKFSDVGKPKVIKPKSEYQLPEEFRELLEGLLMYTNQTRVDSVVSKEGPNLPEPKLYGLAVADIYETYSREHPDCQKLEELQKNTKAKKYINGLLMKTLKEN